MRPRVQRASGIPCALWILRAGRSIASLGRFATRERCHTFGCHHPRRRVTQYSRGADERTEKPRRTGSPAFAEDDTSLVARSCKFNSEQFATNLLLQTTRDWRCGWRLDVNKCPA